MNDIILFILSQILNGFSWIILVNNCVLQSFIRFYLFLLIFLSFLLVSFHQVVRDRSVMTVIHISLVFLLRINIISKCIATSGIILISWISPVRYDLSRWFGSVTICLSLLWYRHFSLGKWAFEITPLSWLPNLSLWFSCGYHILLDLIGSHTFEVHGSFNSIILHVSSGI